MAPTEKKSGNEPQSYGSSEEWQTGNTGGTIENRPQKSEPASDAFYDSRHDGETSPPDQGGFVSPKTESDQADAMHADTSATPISDSDIRKMSQASGEPRHSYFRDRDYKE